MNHIHINSARDKDRLMRQISFYKRENMDLRHLVEQAYKEGLSARVDLTIDTDRAWEESTSRQILEEIK